MHSILNGVNIMVSVPFTNAELKDAFYCVREQVMTSCNNKHIEGFEKVIDKMRTAIDRKKKEDKDFEW